MRPIKFRAWDKEEKRMISDVAVSPQQNALIFGSWIKVGDMGAQKRDLSEYPAKRVELMQFTGLLDKNGKEIWEGDKVREIYGDTALDHSIRWSDVNSGFWLGTARHLNAGTAKEIEVIGNIYESN